MLSHSRIIEIGETPYEHERDAILFAQNELPNHDPYQLWALLDLLDSPTGRLYEIDLLILGYSALYLVEIKSGPGRYEGDAVDWSRTPPTPAGGKSQWLEPPFRLANHKAKVLKSRLLSRLKDPHNAPRVEPIVFLSHPDIELRFQPEGMRGVVTRKTFLRAITHHEFPGAPSDWQHHRIDAPRARDITQALTAMGIRARKGKMYVGAYELGEVLEDGSGYQDRLALHRQNSAFRRRARIYLVPQQTSVERRQQLRRAADREAQLLYEVREHPNILQLTDYITDAAVGPTVLFDAFDEGIPLDAFLRQNPSISFGERVSLVEQIARALAFCHRKGILHGALGPHALLVRRHPETGELQARLHGFMLGVGREVEATSHWTALAAEPWAIYQAPELRDHQQGQRGPQTELADIYSLGALAHLVFTGRPPGESIVDVDERLTRDRCLDPRAVDDGLPEPVAKVIAFATDLRLAIRADDVDEWIELLLDCATSPSEPDPGAKDPDPLEARKDDILGEDLIVYGVLGHGASSRVLGVENSKDNRRYALKISLSPDHEERFQHEARALGALRHPRIVQLIAERRIGERACLLLSLAGEQTLQRLLAREGTVSLDFASRYGEDLISALEELEEKQIVHRDIKPANLGVSADPPRLCLFDFSLVHVGRTELGVGTSAYRDPFLSQRGTWDPAADRWSAAITLHEMLTGVRPTITPLAPALISAERFDPAVRDRLVGFFERALASELELRFPSAKAMKHAWIACFGPASTRERAPKASRPKAEREPASLSDAELAALGPEAAIEALPLSPRARNALDRAGLVRAAEILELQDNRLSAMRGVGRLVAREILSFRARLQKALSLAPAPTKVFFAGYRGEDLLVSTAGIEPKIALFLADAGLHTLAALASAPEQQVCAILARHGAEPKALLELLDRENRLANERAKPSTLEGWLEALFSRPKKRAVYIRSFFGLEEPFQGRIDVAVAEVAAHHGVTRANIYLALGACRTAWQKHGALGELQAMVHEIVDQAGGAIALGRAGEELLVRIPHDRSTGEALLRARAAALVRVVCEVEREEASGLVWSRIRDEAPWVLASSAHGAAVAALGEAADELASRAVLASPGEAARVLGEVARGTPFEGVSVERLLEVAAAASRGAARSTRLEIYPRKMAASRALELCASVLSGVVGPEEIAQRVLARYPEAEALPARPELDALLLPHGLRWVAATARYERPGERHATTLETTFSSSSSSSSVFLASRARAQEPASLSVVEFEDRIRNAVDRRALRVLGVTADRAREAALALSEMLGVAPINLDSVLLKAIRGLMAKHGVASDVVHTADREGPGGASWENLVRLSEMAADEVARGLFPPSRPLVLAQPGLVARYRLEGFVDALVAASKKDEAAAIFLLVPSRDTGTIPQINGEMSIRGILPSQVMWAPSGWPRRVSGSMDQVSAALV